MWNPPQEFAQEFLKCFTILKSSYGKLLLDQTVWRVQIRSFSWSVFPRIWTEYGKLRTRKNSVFGLFSSSAKEKNLFWIDSGKTKGSSILHLRKVLRKINVSYPSIRRRMCAYQGLRSFSFLKKFYGRTKLMIGK